MSRKETLPLAPLVQERDEALLALDEERIVAYCRHWQVRMPGPVGSAVWWAGVHKARLMVPGIPAAEKERSRQWLKEHGFRSG